MKMDEVFSHTFKAMRRRLDEQRAEGRRLWQQRLGTASEFCRAVVSNGYLSETQMQRAAQRYRLGASRDGGVIFWQIDVRRLFSDAIAGRQQVTGAELRSEVCRLSNIRSWKFYNSLLEQAVNSEVIMKSYDHAAHVIYALRPQAPIQTELYQDDEPF